MPRELLILRHGKTEWSRSTKDRHHPLKDSGKRGAQRIGVYLARQACEPDHIVTSPAERALTTAEKACKAMGRGIDGIVVDPRIYPGDLGDLLKVLASSPPSAHRVLLVGHNPGLEDLLTFLTPSTERSSDGKLLPTATLARLRLTEKWCRLTASSASLISITRPRHLPKKFPFPLPDSKELRDRPAYYYRQSAVVPFRRKRGRMEVLIVSSSQHKHWVVPKGILEPGLSPQDSAAKEAFEEAGIEGRVSKHALGTYEYQKWGATCTVEVFAMEIDRLLPKEDWEESHRGRKWVRPEKAKKLLKQKELAPIIDRLVGL